MRRRSLSNPALRTEARRTTQLLKIRGSSVEGSQIPRPRIRSLSTDRLSGRKSTLRSSGKTSMGHAPTTPKTPSYSRSNVIQMPNRTGISPSAERASVLVTKAPKKDSRPITDKSFQSQMLKKIDNYFHNIQQSSMLNSNGSLKPLTIKMFVEVSGLLIGLLGAKVTLTTSNYVEELPKIAKKLLYPGQVAKSWMKTANAMHAWPNVLAWLSWLVEMCEVKDIAIEHYRIENLPFSNINDQAETHKHMFFSMLNFYNAWNEEKLELEENLVAEFLKSEEARFDVSEEAYKIASDECKVAIEELKKEDELREKLDLEIKQMEDLLRNFEDDERKIIAYNDELSEHIKSCSTEIQQIKSDCCILDEEMEKQRAKQEELKSIIKKQPISPRERDEIVTKCDDVKKYLYQFEIHLQEIQKDVYSQDLKLSHVNQNLTKIILEYNRDIHNYLDAIVDINIEEIQIPEKIISDPHSIDTLEEISSALTKLKEKIRSELEEVEALVKPCTTKLKCLNEKVKTLVRDNEELEKKSEEKELRISKIKKQAKVQEEELRANIKSLEQNIKHIQDSRPDLKALQSQLSEKLDKRNSVSRRKNCLEKRAYNFFDKMYAIIAVHRKECSDILDKVKKSKQ